MTISIGKDVLSTTDFLSVYNLNVTPLICSRWLLSLDKLTRFDAYFNQGLSDQRIPITSYSQLYTAYMYEYRKNLSSFIIEGYYDDVSVSFCVDFSMAQLRIRTYRTEVLEELHDLITSEILE